MPTGPFGFPRITDLGPFVIDEDDIKYIRDEKEIMLKELDLEEETEMFIEKGIISESPFMVKESAILQPSLTEAEKIKKINEELTVEDKDDLDDFVDNIMGLAEYSYVYDKGSDDALIAYVAVKRRIQNRGVGTIMKEKMHEDMRSKGIKDVWTHIETPAGRALAKSTGYTRPAPKFEDNRNVLFRTLNPEG